MHICRPGHGQAPTRDDYCILPYGIVRTDVNHALQLYEPGTRRSAGWRALADRDAVRTRPLAREDFAVAAIVLDIGGFRYVDDGQ